MLKKTDANVESKSIESIESIQNEIKKEIEDSFDKGRKSSLTNPIFSSLYDPREDGRVPSIRPSEDFIIACSKIGAFLTDKEAVVKQLKRLNTLIEKKAVDGKVKVKDLRNVLEEELGSLGFYPKFGKTFGNIPPDAFRAAIANGLLLKDAILGNEYHGEFTHLIQWLAIAWQQEDTNFLNCKAVDIFKQLGSEASVYMRQPIYPEQDPKRRREELGVWDLIVDRFGTTDFRTPSTFQKFLLENDQSDLSLLKDLLTLRREKRIEDGAIDKLKLKYNNNPNTFYHKGNLPFVHEPENLEIDLESFRNNS